MSRWCSNQLSYAPVGVAYYTHADAVRQALHDIDHTTAASLGCLRSAGRRVRHSQAVLLQAPDLVAQPRRLLELEIARVLEHLRFQLLDLLHRLRRRQAIGFRLLRHPSAL